MAWRKRPSQSRSSADGTPKLGSTSRRRTFVLVAGVAVALIVVSSLSATARARAVQHPELRIGWDSPIATVNPVFAPAGLQGAVPVFAPLISMTAKSTYAPGLATSWGYVHTNAGPNKAFELTLRHNARFSDGTPVTAAAVTTWLNYFAGAAGPYSALLGPKPKFQALGKWTVKMTLEVPNPDIPYILSEEDWGFVESPKALANPTILGTQTFAAGPYVLDPSQTVFGDTYTFVPNRYYYDTSKVRWSKITVKVITSASSMLQAMESGQLDVAHGSLETIGQAASAGLNVVLGVGDTDVLVIMDRNGSIVPALKDPRVRQALNYAINRKAIASALVGKYGTAVSELPILGRAVAGQPNPYPYNPAKAKSLLSAAGYPNGFTIPTISMGWDGALGTPTLEAVAQNLEAIGVQLKIDDVQTVTAWANDISSKQYAIFQNGSMVTRPMSPFFGIALSPTGASWNPFQQSDPVLNKLWLKGITAANPNKDWASLSARYTSQADFVPLYTSPRVFYTTKHVGGVAVAEAGVGAGDDPTEWFPN